jgi:hypothetical protein
MTSSTTPEFPNAATAVSELRNQPELLDRAEAQIDAEIQRRAQMMDATATQSQRDSGAEHS